MGGPEGVAILECIGNGSRDCVANQKKSTFVTTRLSKGKIENIDENWKIIAFMACLGNDSTEWAANRPLLIQPSCTRKKAVHREN